MLQTAPSPETVNNFLNALALKVDRFIQLLIKSTYMSRNSVPAMSDKIGVVISSVFRTTEAYFSFEIGAFVENYGKTVYVSF